MWTAWGETIEKLVKEKLLHFAGPEAVDIYFDQVIQSLRKEYTISIYPSMVLDIPPWVDFEVRKFIEKKRQQLADDHKQLIASVIEEQPLPQSLREFASYYANTLPQRVFERVRAARLENVPVKDLHEWLTNYTRKVLETEFTSDAGELRDEELVRLYRAGYVSCRTILLERCAVKLHQLVPRIIRGRSIPICPLSEDPAEFAKDVAQEVSLKLLTELDTFDFRSSFDTWLGTICENEAYTKRRKVLGRSSKGERQYVSIEGLQMASTELVIRLFDHREILHKAMDKHRARGERAEKSTRAIELRHFEEMETSKIAQHLGTTSGYVAQLFSHDYPEIRRICIEDFGVSGTEL